MKTRLIACAIVAAGLLNASAAFAGTGKAVVPFWHAYDGGLDPDMLQQTIVWMSNITTHDLEVKVTFYQEDGTKVSSSYLTFVNFQNSDAEIGANESGYVVIVTPVQHFGRAVIEWSNKGTDDDTVGLVAWGTWVQRGVERAHSIQINNGMPF